MDTAGIGVLVWDFCVSGNFVQDPLVAVCDVLWVVLGCTVGVGTKDWGLGGGAGCFPLDTGGVGSGLGSGDGSLEILGSTLACCASVLGLLATFCRAVVIDVSADWRSVSTLAVSLPGLLALSSSSSLLSVSEASDPLK